MCIEDVSTGQKYPLRSAVTHIGRLDDDDIVLSKTKLSRHHTVLVDTGANYLEVDHHSADGICVERLLTAPASEANRHELAFHIRTEEAG